MSQIMQWQPISEAPKTAPIGSGEPALCVLGWCPDDTAPNGGDQKVVWWEPGYKKWWSDGDIEVRPTLWQPLPSAPGSESPSPALSEMEKELLALIADSLQAINAAVGLGEAEYQGHDRRAAKYDAIVGLYRNRANVAIAKARAEGRAP